MPRAKVILQADFPYSVGARCINKEWFGVPMDTVWRIMTDQLFFIHHALNAKIHSFVLMSNHFHLLVSTPEANLSDIMAYFMRETSRSLTAAGGRINQTYGSRYFRTVIGSHHYYLNSYKYVYRNPVEAGLCEKCEDYQYSTLPGLLGHGRLNIPVVADTTLFSDTTQTLTWLNESVTASDWAATGKALKKTHFKLATDKNSRNPNHLEIDLL